MKKKLFTILLGTAMCATLFAGCGSKDTATATGTGKDTISETKESSQSEAQQSEAQQETVAADLDPMEKIVGSRYAFSYPIEGMDDMVQYFHFYGDDLGIGATFYASYAWNQVTFAGTYTIEETDSDYAVLEAQGGEEVTGTAPYTITFFDMDGNELDKAGFDGDYFYNTTTQVNTDPMTGGGQYKMSYVDEETFTKYQKTFEGEIGTPYIKFVSPEDASATVTLNTNGSYEDMVIMMVEGTWAKDGETYTLTPASDSDNGAAIAAAEDGTYKYTSTDGTEVVLATDTGATEGFKFAGVIQVQGMDADLVVTTYDDGTCIAAASLGGMSLDIDQGTYTVAEDGFTYTFSFDAAGEIVSELGGDTGVQVHYVQAGNAQVGDVDTMLAVVLPQ